VDFPYQLGILQFVLAGVAFLSIVLLIVSARRLAATDMLVSLILAICALFTLYGSVAIQAYSAGRDIRVAHIHASRIANAATPTLSVELVLYDQSGAITSDKAYLVQGDEWMVQADIVKVSGALTIVGLHSGYKLTRLEGRFDDPNQERNARHSVVTLNGGDDSFFSWTRTLSPILAPFIDAEYGSATFNGAGNFNIYVSQTGLWAKGV